MTALKVTALCFAIAGLACAIKAVYWLQASREYPLELAQSIGDPPELHIQNVQVSMGKAGALNAKAAIWTGVAAVLGSISSRRLLNSEPWMDLAPIDLRK
jgi:hypothetical protein